MTTCEKCGKDKEPTRVKSRLCRACDSAGRVRKEASGSRRVSVDIPADVWTRLDNEARVNNQTIRQHLAGLIIARDKRRQQGDQ